ncbi:hypothetical protein PspLS_03533 [Pyricularia sp. CBS 133598]|nr:hypothetical protein PspLS_03533 [Pyricularia sp. CBS 133598]
MLSSISPNPFLQSPNAIPPRTSSSGIHSNQIAPSKPALRPVPEGDWIAQSLKQQQASIASATAAAPATTRRMRKATSDTPPDDADPHMLNHQTQAPTRFDANRYATEDFNFTTTKKTWSEDKEKVICGPFDYLLGQPGKDFRTQIIMAFNAWLEVPPESLGLVTHVVGMLHTASLLVDDVEDNSSLRRGLPVAHSIFGVPQTINSANYIYFAALQELKKLSNPEEAVTIFAEELIHLHRGQGMDLFWRDTLTCPTEDDYLEMVGNKTGGLFRLGIKLMQAESAFPSDCIPLANLIGLIFQIRDDYQNLFSREYSNNKGMCEDLTEGKFSFPVIHSIRSNPANLQLLNILKQKTTDEGVKNYAVSYMEKTGSFEYTKKVLTVLIERARKVTDELDAGRGKCSGIHKLLDKMVVE